MCVCVCVCVCVCLCVCVGSMFICEHASKKGILAIVIKMFRIYQNSQMIQNFQFLFYSIKLLI